MSSDTWFKRLIDLHCHLIAFLLVFLSLAGDLSSCFTLRAANNPSQRNQPGTIRDIDFFNFTHRLSCLDDTDEPNQIAVRNGEFKPEDGGYFLVRSITYGDLNRDGRDEAVVVTLCNGGGTGNFTEGLIYTMRGGRPVVLSGVAGGDRAHEGIATVKIRDGLLHVGRYGTNTGGACCPEFVETRTYRLTNDHLIEVGRPARSASRDFTAASPPPLPIVFRHDLTYSVITGTVDFIMTFSVRARAGQRITVRLASTAPNDHSLVLRLNTRDGETLQPVVTRNLRGSEWSGILPQDGEYVIEVISFNEAQHARLEVRITDLR